MPQYWGGPLGVLWGDAELEERDVDILLRCQARRWKHKRIYQGCVTRGGMQRMMFKLGYCAQKKWGRLRRFDQLAKVITGIRFKDEIKVTEFDQAAA